MNGDRAGAFEAFHGHWHSRPITTRSKAHGLQEINGWRLELPRRRAELPDRDALTERYQAFRRAG